MREQKIKALLSVEKSTIPTSVRMPKILLDKLLESYEKKVGAIKDRGATSSAIIYFAARGVVDWIENHGELPAVKKNQTDGPHIRETPR